MTARSVYPIDLDAADWAQKKRKVSPWGRIDPLPPLAMRIRVKPPADSNGLTGTGSRPAVDLRFAISQQVRCARDDGGLVLFNTETGLYLTLNPIGALVWAQVEERKSVSAIIQHLQRAFDVRKEILERDVQAMLLDLEGRGLLVRANTQQDGYREAMASRLPETALRSPCIGADPALGANRRGDSWSSLDGRGVTLFWKAMSLLALIYIDVLANLFPFGRLYEVMSRRRKAAIEIDPLIVQRISCSLNWAATAYFKRTWCLQRSAACVLLLRLQGFPANLVFGVRTFPFEAHAWAELEGRVINDRAVYVERFLVLDRV